jgi:sugar O-acyltransferase (sialic acid O-acetyltransferase NeuD family)
MTGIKQKLLIIGDGETAELAYSYFTRDSNYEVVGFSAEKMHRRNQTLLGLPVVDFEDAQNRFNPENHSAFVAISYTMLNRLRSRLFCLTKQKGYRLASYVDPTAYVAKEAVLGENCFIQENAAIQHGAKIGDDVTLWSGAAVGHRSVIGSHCFLATHAAVSGFCKVGDNSFLGANCCTVGNIEIGADCIVGAGAVVIRNAMFGRVYVGNPAAALPDRSTDIYISGARTI